MAHKLFAMYYCVEIVRIENNSHMLGNAFKIAFFRFLKFFFFFCCYSLKGVEIWFVGHETWNTTVFAMYFVVEMLKIENKSRILGVTFEVAFLRFLKLLWQLLS